MNTEPIDAMTRAINEYLLLANAVGISADDITGQIANRAMARVGLSRTDETPSLWPLGKRIARAGVSDRLWNLMTEEQREALAECIQDHITKPFLAPAPVEQAAPKSNWTNEEKALEITRAIFPELCTGFSDDYCEFMQAARVVDRVLASPHFQSLATEKPTSSPGETGGEVYISPEKAERMVNDMMAQPAQSQAPMTPTDELRQKLKELNASFSDYQPPRLMTDPQREGLPTSHLPQMSFVAKSLTPRTDRLRDSLLDAISRYHNGQIYADDLQAFIKLLFADLAHIETALAAAKEELGMLRELVGVRADAAACAADAEHWLKMMAKADRVPGLEADRDALAEKLRTLQQVGEADKPITGETSDGYHTFNELYSHRCTLFLALMRLAPELSWVSTKHADNSTFGDWFVAGMRLPTGDVTYHLPASMWSLACEIGVPVRQRAPEWDGHTSADVVKRIQAWLRLARQPDQRQGEGV